MKFIDRLIDGVCRKQTPLVVGLDPHFDLLPAACRAPVISPLDSAAGRGQAAEACAGFCCGVLDAVQHLVPAVKPQMAFFEQWGPAGMTALRRVVDHAQHYDLIVILDGKRNDIGSTAKAYATALLGRGQSSAFGGDALTVNPWMGRDSLTPFVDRCRATNAGLFVLVKTSNPGSRDFQDLRTHAGCNYEVVADEVEDMALADLGQRGYGLVGAVVGATYPEQLAQLRQRMPHAYFLIPGFGAQGATAADLAAGFDSHGLGAVVNSSRGILFGPDSDRGRRETTADWQRDVEAATRLAIENLAAHTPAGRLRTGQN